MKKSCNKPLVSVFIPYYDDEKFLREAIDAVLESTYSNFELILLNHATEDSCREIAHSYNDPRIKHIDETKNLGGGSGLLLQHFLDIAKGKYVKVLSADEVLTEDGLSILVDYMENNQGKDFAFGNVEYIDKNSKDLNVNHFSHRRNVIHCNYRS